MHIPPPLLVITGAATGAGYECARRLGHRGALVLADADAGELAQTARHLRLDGYAIDATCSDAPPAIARALAGRPIEALVHAAEADDAPAVAQAMALLGAGSVWVGRGGIGVCVSEAPGAESLATLCREVAPAWERDGRRLVCARPGARHPVNARELAAAVDELVATRAVGRPGTDLIVGEHPAPARPRRFTRSAVRPTAAA